MTDFRELAACRDAPDPELWFPVAEPGSDAYNAQALPARLECFACPVRLECLAWALGNGEADGIWGGLDPDERRELRARRSTLVPL